MNTISRALLTTAALLVLAAPALAQSDLDFYPDNQDLMTSEVPDSIAVTAPDPMPNVGTTPPSRSFLQAMEAWQRRITLLTYSLRATELEVQRAEQQQRLKDIEGRTSSSAFGGLIGSGDSGAGDIDFVTKMIMDQMEGQPQKQDFEEAIPTTLPIRVVGIKGVGDKLTARVFTPSGGLIMVEPGTILPDGRAVVNITGSAVHLEEPTGEIRSYGLAGSTVTLETSGLE
ncbi:MAG: type IV pilus biogenesis protein PilP [Pseudomonadota bacterium]|nr:type IV pilus biogenesis protein PilP [Pseudomonadota bacterium]